ncbi:hypothetical protein V6N13_022007 [Hibiscus sabdariffa]
MRRSLSLMVVEASPLPFSSAQHLHLDFMIVPSIFAAKLLFGGFMNDLNVRPDFWSFVDCGCNVGSC